MNTKRILRSAVVALAFATAAGAAGAADISVTDVWARAVPGGSEVGAAFMTIANTGAKADTLTGAATEVAKTPELHTHVHDGAIMRMRKVDSIPVPAGQTVALKPGAEHVMLMGLKRPLKEGDTFPMTLTFREAGMVTVQARVMGLGDMTHQNH